MHLNSNSRDAAPEELEIEVTCIMVNCMERCRLLAGKVLETVQDEVFCLARFTYSQQIAERTSEIKRKRTFEELVPEHYHDFTKVFSEEESQRLPDHQPWDHTIDLEPDVQLHWKVRTYPMSPEEQVELHKFIKEHIAKGYLVLSKSPMASPVFFI